MHIFPHILVTKSRRMSRNMNVNGQLLSYYKILKLLICLR